MAILLGTVAVTAVVLLGTCLRTPVRKATVRAKNPTSYAFSATVPELQVAIEEVFRLENQWKVPLFPPVPTKFPVGVSYLSYNHPTLRRPEDLLLLPLRLDEAKHSQCFILDPELGALCQSTVYFSNGKPLKFLARFHLHIESLDAGTTRVTVEAIDPKVVNGTRFGMGPCGFGNFPNLEPVAPTTVEEFTILRYIGRHLGITDMPEVIHPARGE
ncbi:MAG: hypothetical protein L0Z55_12040 [Planctomycetes bacterium]|nr:hypothetical protein [Planctomycetota bacterium]